MNVRNVDLLLYSNKVNSSHKWTLKKEKKKVKNYCATLSGSDDGGKCSKSGGGVSLSPGKTRSV